MGRNRGGTLAEVVVTIGLVGVIAGLGAPRLVELVRVARVAGAARAVATTLRAARARAIAGAGPVEVRFDASARHVVVSDQAGTPIETRPLAGGVAFGALPARASYEQARGQRFPGSELSARLHLQHARAADAAQQGRFCPPQSIPQRRMLSAPADRVRSSGLRGGTPDRRRIRLPWAAW